MSTDPRLRFRLIDLFIGTGVVAFLLMVFVPRFSRTHNYPSQLHCQYNLDQITKAMINYESSHGRYPGYQGTLRSRAGYEMQVSWIVPILRQLDRPDLDNLYHSVDRAAEPEKLDSLMYRPPESERFLEILRCPFDRRDGRTGGRTNYVANCGRADDPTGLAAGQPLDFPDNGVFQADTYYFDGGGALFQLGGLSQKSDGNFISSHDGATNTLLFAETLDAGNWWDLAERDVGFVWYPFVDPLPTHPVDYSVCRINAQGGERPEKSATLRYARPSSNHAGGVNVSFADGHTRFLSDEMSYHVYTLLMTPNGRNAREPAMGAPTVLLNADRGQSPATLLREEDIP